MLIIRDLKITLGARTLFENASFQVNYGDRVALVGPNGAGKTTLFSIILKEREPDTGTVERDEWTMVGHLPQEAEGQDDETVLDVATGRVDELPQLVNVARGEMRFIGPRPLPASDQRHYTRPCHELRLKGVPGMTGLWQVAGRNERMFEEMCLLDYCYLCNRSAALDLRIIGRTLGLIFHRKV